MTSRAVPDVHVVLPNDIDDPATPSGGNAYDRRVCDGLTATGATVREHAVAGTWPRPGPADRAALDRVLAGLPVDAVVLIDGLIASCVPDVLAPYAGRLRLVILMHLPLDDDGERAALATAHMIVATSDDTRRWLRERYGLAADRVRVAAPGVDPAPVTDCSVTGNRLLSVAAVVPRKGHDLLTDALAAVADVPWRCAYVGSLRDDAPFAERVRTRIADTGLTERISLTGPLTGAALDARYAAADLLILASRNETYGMVVTEALARGVPVLATDVGGVGEALGRARDGVVPGLLVPPDDRVALAAALRCWLTEPDLRRRLRAAAVDRRATLTGWDDTVYALSAILKEVTS